MNKDAKLDLAALLASGDKARKLVSDWPDWRKQMLYGKVIMDWENLIPQQGETCSEAPVSMRVRCRERR